MNAKSMNSTVDGLPIRSSGYWIRKKHFYLRRYMDIFTKSMKSKWSLTYLDLFAGPGRCLIESSGQEEEGSPLIALNYEFDHYVFVEKSSEDLEALKSRCKKSPKYSKIEFIQDDCNQAASKITLKDLTLAFIDPTGIDIHFDTIKTLARNKKVDLLINIQFGMDIKRNFKRYLSAGDNSAFGLFMGGDLFASSLKEPNDAIKLYKNRIRSEGYSTVESKDITVTNSQQVPMYFLFFASKHPRGVDFWKKITKKDEAGQYELF